MDKILQIIPAPVGTVAEYPPGGERLPVACLALVSCQDGQQRVEPLVAGEWGVSFPGGTCAVIMGKDSSHLPIFTREQCVLAGSALIDAGKGEKLVSLLDSFGLLAVSHLKDEQLGAFSAELCRLWVQP